MNGKAPENGAARAPGPCEAGDPADKLLGVAAMLAHDLQEPLRTVRNYIGLAVARDADAIGERARRYLALAAEAAERMTELIGALVDCAGLGLGAPRPVVRCGDALAGALANLRSAIDESGARIVAGPLPELRADPAALVRLFQNLIANSIKFRGESVPQIRVAARRRGSSWRFSVEDNGPGVEDGRAQGLFEAFHRLRPDLPGRGLGLALCRLIVEGHGGKIWLERSAKGASVRFTLPAEAAGAPAPARGHD